MKILLVEDNRDVAGVIYDYLEIKGHQMDHVYDGLQGYELARNQHYDVIILDVMLPKLNGMDVCEKLRSEGVDTPILMLTARDQNDDILEGFAHGADDYLVKPFDLKILEARLTSLYRRWKGNASKNMLSFEELELNLTNRILTRKGCEISLNQILFRIMKLLLLRAPKIVTRDELIAEIWPDEEPDADLLRSHIYLLRNKVDKPFEYNYIQTIPKVGFQLKPKCYDEADR